MNALVFGKPVTATYEKEKGLEFKLFWFQGLTADSASMILEEGAEVY